MPGGPYNKRCGSLSSVLRREMVSMMSLCAATSAERGDVLLHPHLVLLRLIRGAHRRLALVRLPLLPTWGSLSTSISTESVIAPFAGSCRARRVPTRRCASRDENAPLASRLASREGASARACVRSPSPVRDRDCGAREPRATRGAYDRRFSRNAIAGHPSSLCDARSAIFSSAQRFYTTVRGNIFRDRRSSRRLWYLRTTPLEHEIHTIDATHHGTSSYSPNRNAAPTSVMNGLSHVCGAYASVIVMSGGSAASATAYCASVNSRQSSPPTPPRTEARRGAQIGKRRTSPLAFA